MVTFSNREYGLKRVDGAVMQADFRPARLQAQRTKVTKHRTQGMGVIRGSEGEPILPAGDVSIGAGAGHDAAYGVCACGNLNREPIVN
jgi:hypothetical protein